MPRRRVIEVPGVRHAAPIPMGCRIGNMVFSSGITGKDPDTGDLSEDPERQARFCFQNMRTLVERAGGTVADIGHITVFIKSDDMREHVNKPWLEMFPDEDDRPARHTIVHDLPGGMLVQLEIVAVVEAAEAR